MKKLLVILALLAAALGLGTADKAGAQSGYDFFDYGWVQGFYGGVHIYVYDHCHYVSGAALDTCLEIHYDHDVNGTMVYDADYLPEGMWIGAINAGHYYSSGLWITWVPRDQYGPYGYTRWWPGDDASTCPTGQQVCGLNSGGVLIQGGSPTTYTKYAGNTAHARAFQVSVQSGDTIGGVYYDRALTVLF